jgi:hypothetical protein
MPDLQAIREELEKTTPYSQAEIAELLANVRVDPAEVKRMQTQYENHTGRPCRTRYFGRTTFNYAHWSQHRFFRRFGFLERLYPACRRELIVPE